MIETTDTTITRPAPCVCKRFGQTFTPRFGVGRPPVFCGPRCWLRLTELARHPRPARSLDQLTPRRRATYLAVEEHMRRHPDLWYGAACRALGLSVGTYHNARRDPFGPDVGVATDDEAFSCEDEW